MDNAEYMRSLRKTGNYPRYVPDEDLVHVLDIVGRKHKNGLALIPEVGIVKSNLNAHVERNPAPRALAVEITCPSIHVTQHLNDTAMQVNEAPFSVQRKYI